jgi:cytoskeletal protein CcmA (bactofilin family)
MFGNKDRQTENNDMPTINAPSAAPSRNAKQDSITAYLGPDTQIDGTLRFDNSVLIEGKFQGKIQSDNGTLVVGESAVVEADIQAGHVTVRGKVTGSIEATQRVHLQDKGIFSGELTTPSLQMDESVTFDGSCKMPKPGEKKQPSQTISKDKKTDQDQILEAVQSVK